MLSLSLSVSLCPFVTRNFSTDQHTYTIILNNKTKWSIHSHTHQHAHIIQHSMCILYGGKITISLVIVSVCSVKTLETKSCVYVSIYVSPSIRFCSAYYYVASLVYRVCVFTYAQKETLLPGVFDSFESSSTSTSFYRFVSHAFANIVYYSNCKMALNHFHLDSYTYIEHCTFSNQIHRTKQMKKKKRKERKPK